MPRKRCAEKSHLRQKQLQHYLQRSTVRIRCLTTSTCDTELATQSADRCAVCLTHELDLPSRHAPALCELHYLHEQAQSAAVQDPELGVRGLSPAAAAAAALEPERSTHSRMVVAGSSRPRLHVRRHQIRHVLIPVRDWPRCQCCFILQDCSEHHLHGPATFAESSTLAEGWKQGNEATAHLRLLLRLLQRLKGRVHGVMKLPFSSIVQTGQISLPSVGCLECKRGAFGRRRRRAQRKARVGAQLYTTGHQMAQVTMRDRKAQTCGSCCCRSSGSGGCVMAAGGVSFRARTAWRAHAGLMISYAAIRVCQYNAL